MRKKWRHGVLCALIAIGSSLAAWSLDSIRFFHILNLKAYDLHFIVRGRQPTSNIVLLTEDQKAIDTFTDEMRVFWHKHYADAIGIAAESGAKAIGLDHAFGIPVRQWYEDYDRRLAKAVIDAREASVPVITTYVPELNSNKEAGNVQINIMAAMWDLAAFPNLKADPDDFIRDQALIETSKAGELPPRHSFGLHIAEGYLGAKAQFENGRLTLQGRPIPITPEGSIAINYAGPAGTFPRVSLADFEAASKAGNKEQLRQWVNGKIVLIGTDWVDDRFLTPFFTPTVKSTMAGIEIHANTLRTLLDRRFLLQVPSWARVLGLLLATAITVLLATSLATGRAAGLILLLAAAILVFTHLLFLSGLVLSTSEMILAMIICVIASVVYRFSTAEKRGNLFHRAVSLFVGKQLARTLEETEAIGLTGKLLNVTILFTDIRGFTAFTEKVCDEQGPEAVVQMLNEYMAAMCAIIVKYHGHVNKFIGDGILAIFSDDDENAKPGDHPLRAVLCATEIVTLPGRFQTGAGIHTGPAVVGNVGSADKMEYTVLGDTVNLASRLESLNKEHHTKLLMTGVTQGLLGNAVETVHLADAPVRGKALPIALYTVASLVPKAAVNA